LQPKEVVATEADVSAASDEWSAATPDLERLSVLYRRLMIGYADALGEAERLGRRRAGRDWYLFAPFVRLLTGGHVRSKLRAVAARSAQLEATLDRDRDVVVRTLLADVRETAERTAASLPSLRLPTLFALLSFLVGLAPAIGKLLDVGVPTAVWLGVGLAVLVMAGLSYRDLHDAFRRKRELLLPGAAKLDREDHDAQKDHEGKNVYNDEDELFALLGIGKRREAELDRIAFVVLVLFLTQVAYLAGIVLGRSSEAGAWVAVSFAFVLTIVFLVFDRRAPRRYWH